VPGISTARCNCANETAALRLEWSAFDGSRRLEPAPLHPAPAAECQCGLYSWRRPPASWNTDPSRVALPRVVGAVACWGHLRVHGDGLRAEHACVVTLAHGDDIDSDTRTTLQRIARTYRVELVPLAQLEHAARQHGAALPDEVRPPAGDTDTVEAPATHLAAQQSDPPQPATDATPDEVGPPTALGFDGGPLKRSGSGFSGGAYPFI
jgi:hypothetical protein